MTQGSEQRRVGSRARAAFVLLVLGLGGCVGPGLEPPGKGNKGSGPAFDSSGAAGTAGASGAGSGQVTTAGTGASASAGTGAGASPAADAGANELNGDDAGLTEDAATLDAGDAH